jgi:hypothetical protein
MTYRSGFLGKLKDFSSEAQNLVGYTAMFLIECRSTALMMEAARTSETPVNIQVRTRQYIPEDSGLHTRRRENLKSHKFQFCLPMGRFAPTRKPF